MILPIIYFSFNIYDHLMALPIFFFDTVIFYEFVHDGHCASGWNEPNTVQESILDCRNECAGRPDVGFFAYKLGANCACYFLKDGCPDDDQHGDHDAYLIVNKGGILLKIWMLY